LPDKGGIEADEMYEFERDTAAGDMDDEEEPWGITVNLGVGEPLEPMSLRRTASLWPETPWSSISSDGGLAARRFWPTEA